MGENRFRSEFGDSRDAEAPSPPPLSLWLSPPREIDPARLASLQLHAWRIEALYPAPDSQRPTRIEFGYIDRSKVVRASRENSPSGIYLSHGVWAEVAHLIRADRRLDPTPSSPPDWNSPSALAFLASLLPARSNPDPSAPKLSPAIDP